MVPPRPILRSIAADSSLALILIGLSGPLWYLTTLIMARYYGAQEMGTYFIAWNMVLIISGICRMGLDLGLLRFSAVLKAKGQVRGLKRLFWPAIGVITLLGMVAVVFLYLGREWLAQRFNAPSLPLVLVLVAPTLPFFAASSAFRETIRSLGGIKCVVFQKNCLTNLTLIAFLLILAYGGGNFIDKYGALGLAALLSVMVNLGFLAIYLRLWMQREGADTAGDSGDNSFKELLRYSWPLFITSLLPTLAAIDRLILGYFTSPQEVAYYEVAAKTETLITLPLAAFNSVIPPLVVKFFESGQFASLEMMAQTTARWAYYLSLPLTLLLILLAPEILGLFGANFTKAVFAARVLALAQLVNVASGSVTFILNMTGHQWKVTMARFATTVLAVTLMIGLTKFYGLNGMAVASALGIIGINVFLGLAVWRFLKIKAFAWGVKWINLSALMGILIFLVSKPLAGSVVASVLFLLVYLALLAKPIKREFRLAWQMREGAL
jgi:O-antigen/teichoic acid export membrane protein